MSVSGKDVTRVADLAKLESTADERARLVRDLNSILGYIDRLNELDTGNVAPMVQTSGSFGVDAHKTGSERFAYASRQDIMKPSLPREAALGNAPESDGKFFKVPKVIER